VVVVVIRQGLTRSAGDMEANPLPEFIDSITCDYVERPAIAPHGIVLGHAHRCSLSPVCG
jgi:hypothetical protein